MMFRRTLFLRTAASSFRNFKTKGGASDTDHSCSGDVVIEAFDRGATCRKSDRVLSTGSSGIAPLLKAELALGSSDQKSSCGDAAS